MALLRIAASAEIPAPASKVYAVIADYHNAHPHILPKPPFVSLTVEKGGVGAGTEICFQMQVMGQTQTLHATITEPEPGRLLREAVKENGAVTTFMVEPRDNGQKAFVTIATETKVRDGLFSGLEKWMTTQALLPIYKKELVILAEFMSKQN